MDSGQILVLILISVLIVLLPGIGLYKMFEKAGRPGWKGLVPFLNTWEMLNIARKPKWWFFAQFVPVAGWFFSLLIMIEFVKCFNKFKFYQHAATVFAGVLYMPYIGFNKKDRYIGPEGVKHYKKSTVREWVDAAVFAIVAATLIRTFIFEAYTIPTSSMEKTLLVNDFLFVSKSSYGPRIPNTPIAMPFVHHTMPFTGTRSYVEWIKIPYTRWFAKPVQRNDAVVFNFPAGDTLTKEWDSQVPYYDLVRQLGRDRVWQEYTITTRPVDKRENYIKRCVGIPGDTIQIKGGILYVNGQPAFVSPTSATFYIVETNPGILLDEDMLRNAGLRLNMATQEGTSVDFSTTTTPNIYHLNLTLGEVDIVKKLAGVKSVTREISNDQTLPYDTAVARWTADNFGPLWIPKKGSTIQLTKENIALYERAIHVYENNEFEQRDGKVYINGAATDKYTFKMDYFWMMGDNRHKSQDSRFWGFVPEDHIVGKASLIFFSWENGPRWNRIFRWIK
jgi:signal peptidase I